MVDMELMNLVTISVVAYGIFQFLDTHQESTGTLPWEPACLPDLIAFPQTRDCSFNYFAWALLFHKSWQTGQFPHLAPDPINS